MEVTKLEEAINLLVSDHQDIFKNKIITILKELTKNERIGKLVVAEIKGSFNICLKKCCYKDINLIKRADPNNRVKT
jgi:hypothetical protein